MLGSPQGTLAADVTRRTFIRAAGAGAGFMLYSRAPMGVAQALASVSGAHTLGTARMTAWIATDEDLEQSWEVGRMHTRTWNMTIHLTDDGPRTRAVAVLHTAWARSFDQAGVAPRAPASRRPRGRSRTLPGAGRDPTQECPRGDLNPHALLGH